jgi:hypothetical protein
MHRTHRALSIAGAVVLTASTAACVGTSVPTDGDLRFDGTRLVDAQQSLAGFESTWRGAIANSGRAATFALDSGCFLQVDDAGEVANRILCGPVRVAGDIETSWQSHPVDAVPGSGGGVRLVLARGGGSATATSTTATTTGTADTTGTTSAGTGGSDFQPHAQPDPELRTVRADGTPAFFGDTLPAPRGEGVSTATARPSGTRTTSRPSATGPATTRATGTPSASRSTSATSPTRTSTPSTSAPAPSATSAPAARPTPSAPPRVADAPDDGLATSAAGECPAVTAPSGTASGWRQAFTCTTTLTRTTTLPPAGEASSRRVEGRAAAGRTWVTAVITPTELTTYRTGGPDPREATYDTSYFSFGTKLTVAGTTYLPRQLVVEQAFEGRPPTITAWFEVPTGEARMSLTGWVSTRLERTTTEATDARSEGAFTYAIDQQVVFGRR